MTDDVHPRSILTAGGNIARQTDDVNLILPAGYPPVMQAGCQNTINPWGLSPRQFRAMKNLAEQGENKKVVEPMG